MSAYIKSFSYAMQPYLEPGIWGMDDKTGFFADGVPFLPSGVNIKDLEVVYVDARATNNPRTDVNEYRRYTSAATQAVETNNPRTDVNDLHTSAATQAAETSSQTRQDVVAIFFLILASNGFLANLAAYIATALKSRRNRHYHHLLHIFVSNILLLIPVPFVSYARLRGSWVFGDKCFKALSMIATTSYTVSAFQLTNLAVLRCREVVSQALKRTTVRAKAICYSLWLAAIAVSWPVVVHDDILEDVIKNEALEQRSAWATNYIQLKFLISYVFPSLICAVSFFFTICCKSASRKANYSKIPLKRRSMVKESIIQCVLFFLSWSLFQTCRMLSVVSERKYSACYSASDIFLCIGISYSAVMPIVECACELRRKRNKQKMEVPDAERPLRTTIFNQCQGANQTQV